jgi:hypothetical protein
MVRDGGVVQTCSLRVRSPVAVVPLGCSAAVSMGDVPRPGLWWVVAMSQLWLGGGGDVSEGGRDVRPRNPSRGLLIRS